VIGAVRADSQKVVGGWRKLRESIRRIASVGKTLEFTVDPPPSYSKPPPWNVIPILYSVIKRAVKLQNSL
jgi:hypothetical protein